MATKEEHLASITEWRMTREWSETHSFLIQREEELAKALAERDAAREKIAELERELKNAREAHGIAEQKVDDDGAPEANNPDPSTGVIDTPNGPIPAHAGDVIGITTDKDGNVTKVEAIKAKPAAPLDASEVEGPFRKSYYAEYPMAIIDRHGLNFANIVDVERLDEAIRLLNLGTRAEQMQKRIEELERKESDGCEHCGSNLIARSGCFRCGAPICCQTCCELNSAQMKQNAAEAREKALRELVERWRKNVIRHSYAQVVLDRILAGHCPEDTGPIRPPRQPTDQAPEVTKP